MKVVEAEHQTPDKRVKPERSEFCRVWLGRQINPLRMPKVTNLEAAQLIAEAVLGSIVPV